jgi:hypothetical protein
MKQPQKQKCFPAQREKPKTRCNRHNRQTFFPCNAPALRLDLESARQLLSNTVQSLRPTLLILDPLIRLHRLDENDASQVAGLLSFLRHLQREFQLAVLLVHHARKGSNSSRPGQTLRGSSELCDEEIVTKHPQGYLLQEKAAELFPISHFPFHPSIPIQSHGNGNGKHQS